MKTENNAGKGHKPILSLDFDGVCHMYTSGWKGADVIPDPPVPGLFEFLDSCAPYFDLQIFSSRSHQDGGIEAMREWFSQHRFSYLAGRSFSHENYAAEADRWVENTLSFPKEKPPAFLGIDDRVLNFRGVWPDVEDLRGYKTWTQNPLGATNTFSRGKVHESDEGDLRLACYAKDGTVFVDFGKPTAWIGLDANTTRQLAAALLKHADSIEESA
jgi:hypothetical protein